MTRRIAPDRARRPVRRALRRAGPERADDLRRIRQPRVVPPAAGQEPKPPTCRCSSYDGQPVLTWWQGRIPPQGFGQGEEIIDNSSYRQIGRVHAGNGYMADLHEFHITPQGTALLTVFDPIDCNLSALGGPSGGAVTDSGFQEIDLKTGLVRREWNSLDHVGLAESYSPATTATPIWPFDYFHLNSIDQLADGATLISARNTSALYELNTLTGQVVTRIGGRHSSVKLARRGRHRLPARRHRARQRNDQRLRQRRGPEGPLPVARARPVDRRQDEDRHRRRRIRACHAPAARRAARGTSRRSKTATCSSVGGPSPTSPSSTPTVSSSTTPTARLLSVLPELTASSGRARRAKRRPSPPRAAGGQVIVYASWNGDTRTASWRVLAGPTAQQLTPVASAAARRVRDGDRRARRGGLTWRCRRSAPQAKCSAPRARSPADSLTASSRAHDFPGRPVCTV